MSESHKRRPPVAPKPTFRPGNNNDRGVSPAALRGATLAFSPTASHSPSGVAAKSAAYSARDAAALAERHGRQGPKDRTNVRPAPSPVRGRSQLSFDRHAAGDNPPKPTSRNPLQRTASEIAARAASASSSPARSVAAVSRPSSPQRRQRSLSRDSTLSHGSRLPSDADARDALLSATKSMSASPSTVAASPFSNKVGKLDFDKIPSLAQHVTSPVSVGRQPPPKPRQQAPVDVRGRPEAPQPPPKRLPQKRPGYAAMDRTQSPASVSTPTVTLSEPDEPVARMSKPTVPSKNASQPIPVPLKKIPRTSPPKSVSPHTSSASPRSHNGGMTANDLADAMVGASLASSRRGSRAASPTKYTGPPLPRRRSKSVDLLQPTLTGDRQPPLKPLPRRTMKHTLRKHSPEQEEEEDPRRGRKHRIRKHPHMHNEGDRKRWRDKVSEGERKRYEGVWAANRGLLHEHEVGAVLSQRPHDSSQEELVLNLVVQDIWNRSRLPRDVLEEIWDLVSPEPEYKALNRERFVVGMWLVDQRLKGRKLPIKVSASVWQSVQLVRGIKVSSKPF